MSQADRPPFEVLEHTADIGLRAYGETVEKLFENACRGTLEILDAASEGGHDQEEVVVEAADREALLVSLLDELIYLVDRYQSCVSDIKIQFERETFLVATITWTPAPCDREGTELKATTYHQLSVHEGTDGWEATVYFDV